MTYDKLDPEVFDKAADLIEERGWTQGTAEDPDTGALCLVGAVGNARPLGSGWYIRSMQALADHLDMDFMDVPSWNDTPGRTKQEVLDVLRSVAKAVMKEQDAPFTSDPDKEEGA